MHSVVRRGFSNPGTVARVLRILLGTVRRTLRVLDARL